MKRVILDRKIVSDLWSRPEAPEAVAPRDDVLIAWSWWVADRARWLAHEGRIGVVAPVDADPAVLAADAKYWSVIAIDFSKHNDGRGFSLARLLRERYRYHGELRAVGEVLKDQLFYLSRCGFNAFAVRADRDIEDALRSLDDFPEGYQASVERPVPLFRRRFSEEAIHG